MYIPWISPIHCKILQHSERPTHAVPAPHPKTPEGWQLWPTNLRVPKERTGLDQPGTGGAYVAIPTTGAFKCFPPIEPSNGALPNENTPPSAPASQ